MIVGARKEAHDYTNECCKDRVADLGCSKQLWDIMVCASHETIDSIQKSVKTTEYASGCVRR